MALATPILADNKKPFNVLTASQSNPEKFVFQVRGGDIFDDLGVICFDNRGNKEDGSLEPVDGFNRIDGTSYDWVLKVGSWINFPFMQNGGTYNFGLKTIKNGVESLQSNLIYFKCMSAPILSWQSGATPPNTITTASYEFKLNYRQVDPNYKNKDNVIEPQYELLNYYIVELYNGNTINENNKFFTSERQYVNNTQAPDYPFSYIISGLADNKQYTIRFVGTTVNGATCEKSTSFFINYTVPTVNGAIELVNKCDKGNVEVISHMSIIEGLSYPSPPEYIYNQAVDLTNDGSWVEWNQGYKISGDFTARIWGWNFTPYKNIALFINPITGQSIKLDYMQGYELSNDSIMKTYVQLTVGSPVNGTGIPYYIYSNFIDNPPEGASGQVMIWLRRINNIYELKIEQISTPIPETTLTSLFQNISFINSSGNASITNWNTTNVTGASLVLENMAGTPVDYDDTAIYWSIASNYTANTPFYIKQNITVATNRYYYLGFYNRAGSQSGSSSATFKFENAVDSPIITGSSHDWEFQSIILQQSESPANCTDMTITHSSVDVRGDSVYLDTLVCYDVTSLVNGFNTIAVQELIDNAIYENPDVRPDTITIGG